MSLIRQLWDQYVIIPTSRYRKVMCLKAHSGPVNSLVISGSDLLASGGDDQQVHIWDLNLATRRQTLQDRHGRWGQITNMLAIDDSVVASPILVLGSGRGKIIIFKRPRKQLEFFEISCFQAFDHIDSIESLAYSHSSDRLAVASHSAKIALIQLSLDGTLSRVWHKQLGELSLPRMLNFIEKGSRLMVHTLEGGKVSYIDIDTTAELHSTALKTPIGNGDLCLATKSIIVDNMTTGFDLYGLNRTSPARSYGVPVSRKRVKMVKFGESSTIIVGGSDHGLVYIFDSNTSDLLQVLVHEAYLMQTILTYSTANEHVIVSGVTDESRPGDIYVWKKPTKRFLLHKSGAMIRIGPFAEFVVIFIAESLVVLAIFFLKDSYSSYSATKGIQNIFDWGVDTASNLLGPVIPDTRGVVCTRSVCDQQHSVTQMPLNIVQPKTFAVQQKGFATQRDQGECLSEISGQAGDVVMFGKGQSCPSKKMSIYK